MLSYISVTEFNVRYNGSPRVAQRPSLHAQMSEEEVKFDSSNVIHNILSVLVNNTFVTRKQCFVYVCTPFN